jgi:hypothetical protein
MMTPSLENLKRAIEVAEQIEKLQAELAAMFGGEAAKAVVSTTGRRRGRPAKADKPTKEKKPKRQMSEEARARIVAAQKKRWAKIKKEKKEKKAEAKAEQAKAGA